MIGLKTIAITIVTDQTDRLPSEAMTVTASTISGIARTASMILLTVSSAIPRK